MYAFSFFDTWKKWHYDLRFGIHVFNIVINVHCWLKRNYKILVTEKSRIEIVVSGTQTWSITIEMHYWSFGKLLLWRRMLLCVVSRENIIARFTESYNSLLQVVNTRTRGSVFLIDVLNAPIYFCWKKIKWEHMCIWQISYAQPHPPSSPEK